MTAEAATRCGAGLVSVATRAAHAGLQAAARPEVMFHGVETPEQLALLRDFACDQVQGYLISKPLPITELVEYLTFGAQQKVALDAH